MTDTNQATLEGTAERDAEYKQGQNTNFTTLRLKTTGTAGGAGSDYHNVVAFGPQADELANVVEGTRVRVQGRIKTRNYTNNAGEKKTITEIVAETVKVFATRI